MEPREIAVFVACLALAGIKEAKVSARVFYYMAKDPAAVSGYDKNGRYLDIGASRVRPIYRAPLRLFNDEAEISAFVAQMVKEV